MQPNTGGNAITAATAPRTAKGNAERCKHDLLPGQCGFCPVTSSEPAEPAEHVSGQEFVAWLGRFNHHESPEPGASAGSTANLAISRRRL
jgi:hypothetical protein